ncbi:hypothetical protein PMAC_000634 [Pneumocystis sp. 'macacae']|nr:hypothetical protein PMAC_000634 [Pneumocystis sp. 'macacae']
MRRRQLQGRQSAGAGSRTRGCRVSTAAGQDAPFERSLALKRRRQTSKDVVEVVGLAVALENVCPLGIGCVADGAAGVGAEAVARHPLGIRPAQRERGECSSVCKSSSQAGLLAQEPPAVAARKHLCVEDTEDAGQRSQLSKDANKVCAAEIAGERSSSADPEDGARYGRQRDMSGAAHVSRDQTMSGNARPAQSTETAHAAAQRELGWLVGEVLPGVRQQTDRLLDTCGQALSGTSTLAVSSVQNEALKGVVVREGARVVRWVLFRSGERLGPVGLRGGAAVVLEQVAAAAAAAARVRAAVQEADTRCVPDYPRRDSVHTHSADRSAETVCAEDVCVRECVQWECVRKTAQVFEPALPGHIRVRIGVRQAAVVISVCRLAGQPGARWWHTALAVLGLRTADRAVVYVESLWAKCSADSTVDGRQTEVAEQIEVCTGDAGLAAAVEALRGRSRDHMAGMLRRQVRRTSCGSLGRRSGLLGSMWRRVRGGRRVWEGGVCRGGDVERTEGGSAGAGGAGERLFRRGGGFEDALLYQVGLDAGLGLGQKTYPLLGLEGEAVECVGETLLLCTKLGKESGTECVVGGVGGGRGAREGSLLEPGVLEVGTALEGLFGVPVSVGGFRAAARGVQHGPRTRGRGRSAVLSAMGGRGAGVRVWLRGRAGCVQSPRFQRPVSPREAPSGGSVSDADTPHTL